MRLMCIVGVGQDSSFDQKDLGLNAMTIIGLVIFVTWTGNFFAVLEVLRENSWFVVWNWRCFSCAVCV